MIPEHLFPLVFCLAFADTPADVVEVVPPAPGKFAEFKCDPGKQLILKAAKAAQWELMDDGPQLTVVGDQAVFSAPAAGRFRLVAVADGKLLKIAVTVGNPPPGPNPVPPADQLRAKLVAAFAADKGAKADAQQLVVLYKQLVDLARSEDVASTADLLRRAKASASGMVGPGVLKGLRGVVAEELQAAIGKATEEPITGAERERAAALFTKLVEILAGF